MASASKMGNRSEIASLMAKSGELKSRILFLLGALIVFRIGTFIPVPGVDALTLNSIQQGPTGGVLDMLNMFSGGSHARMAIFAMGIMPYITASIIMQLGGYAFSTLSELKKEGEAGRRKINQYTRYLTVVIAFMQGFGMASLWETQTATMGAETLNLVINPGLAFKLQTAFILMTGAVFLMWLGERITVKGLGNGASILIYAGILAELPSAIYQVIEQMRVGALAGYLGFSVIAIALITVLFAVFIELSQRRLLIQYPKRNAGAGGSAQSNYMPLKVNMAGVMPAIFASAILMAPMYIISAAPNAAISQWIGAYFSPGNFGYMLFYAAMIFGLCFFWVSLSFNTEDVADNMKKNSGFISGIRPGKATAEYLDWILMRLTPVGAVYMVAICILPQLVINQFDVPATAAYLMGGTSLLIIVSVTIALVTSIQEHVIAQKYDSMLKKSKFRRKAKVQR